MNSFVNKESTLKANDLTCKAKAKANDSVFVLKKSLKTILES